MVRTGQASLGTTTTMAVDGRNRDCPYFPIGAHGRGVNPTGISKGRVPEAVFTEE